MSTRYEHYYARAKCLSCGTVMWCTDPNSDVGCVVTCGAAVLHSSGTGTNIAACSDEEHEAACRESGTFADDDIIVLVAD